MDAIDCMGFAGGFTMGTVQAGFRLVGKRENVGGFGMPACENNRHLLGDDWVGEAVEPAAWTPYQVPYVFGNPPCSGFSSGSPQHFRGIDSSINSCMWDLMTFASRCNPDMIVMESVAPAFSKGRPLMQRLREHVEKLTGQEWWMTHVIQDALSLGGCAVRRRYFLVLHRYAFGVEHVELETVPTVMDAIGDLVKQPLSWEQVPYAEGPTWWSYERRSAEGTTDGHQYHMTASGPSRGHTPRLYPELIERLSPYWKQGWTIDQVAIDELERTGEVPEWINAHRRKNMETLGTPNFGFHQAKRWRADQPARVITGDGLRGVIHPTEPRRLTHREVLRILGFPDDWRVAEIQAVRGLSEFWGKGVTVDCGRWISSWVKASLEGEPGSETGDVIGDRENLIDVSKDWRKHTNRERVPLRLLGAA
jgi:site-specific DNA-cytosine methylase